MTDRKLNFGPRSSPDLEWICEDGSPADAGDVGFEISLDEDDAVRVSIGDRYERREWELTPQQQIDLAAFLFIRLGMTQMLPLLETAEP